MSTLMLIFIPMSSEESRRLRDSTEQGTGWVSTYFPCERTSYLGLMTISWRGTISKTPDWHHLQTLGITILSKDHIQGHAVIVSSPFLHSPWLAGDGKRDWHEAWNKSSVLQTCKENLGPDNINALSAYFLQREIVSHRIFENPKISCWDFFRQKHKGTEI